MLCPTETLYYHLYYAVLCLYYHFTLTECFIFAVLMYNNKQPNLPMQEINPEAIHIQLATQELYNGLYPGQPGWAGTRTLETLTHYTTFIVFQFRKSTANLTFQASHSTSRVHPTGTMGVLGRTRNPGTPLKETWKTEQPHRRDSDSISVIMPRYFMSDALTATILPISGLRDELRMWRLA